MLLALQNLSLIHILFEEDNVDYMNAGNGIRIAKWRTGESTGQKAVSYTHLKCSVAINHKNYNLVGTWIYYIPQKWIDRRAA